jgi:hypothetical protein
LGQTFAAGFAREGVVSASIEHDDVHASSRALHGVDDVFDVHGLSGDIAGLAQFGIDRDHVIAPIELQPMPGVIEHANGLLALEECLHLPDGFDHLGLVAVDHFHHFEAQFAQHVRHGFGVVGGIGQGGDVFVGGVADDQGHTHIQRGLGICAECAEEATHHANGQPVSEFQGLH